MTGDPLDALIRELLYERYATTERDLLPAEVTVSPAVLEHRRAVLNAALEGAEDGLTPAGVVVPLVRRRRAA